MAANLLLDTAVQRLPGDSLRYRAELPPSWNWRLPSGGALMTVGLRAIRAAVEDPSFVPISATTTFCRTVPPGIIDIDVNVLRSGNAATQVRAALRSADADGVCLEVSATFARERTGPGIDFQDAVFPDVPAPNEARAFEELQQMGGQTRRFQILENLDMRLALGHLLHEPDWLPGAARFSRWVRYKVPQKNAEGLWDPLALPPIVDMMPMAIRQKIGPQGPQYYAPSLDLTLHFLDPTPSEWLLISSYVRRARAGYATAEAEVWSEDKKLVAFGTQTMILRSPGG